MTDTEPIHEPVMKRELLDQLDLEQSNTVIDATVGFGGHASAILDCLDSDGRLIGLERDPTVYARVKETFQNDPRVHIEQANYRQLDRVLDSLGIGSVDRIYFDLGVNSFHLDSCERGFSFERRKDPLDMRFNPEAGQLSVRDWLKDVSADELTRVLREHGDVRSANQLARSILSAEILESVGDLREAVEDVVPPPYRISQLARVFQALRIHTNRELEALKEGLETAVSRLKPGGRIAVISFHSGEDRIVKKFFRHQAKACICPPDLPVCACDKVQYLSVVTRSPLIPKKEEMEANTRARSAKLRVAEKI